MSALEHQDALAGGPAAPARLPGSPEDAVQLASLVGNTAFSRAVAIREQPTGFHGLLEADKALEEEEKQLKASQATGGEEGPPPTEGGK